MKRLFSRPCFLFWKQGRFFYALFAKVERFGNSRGMEEEQRMCIMHFEKRQDC